MPVDIPGWYGVDVAATYGDDTAGMSTPWVKGDIR